MTIELTTWRPELTGDSPAYLGIVEALASDVAAGTLKSGTRLPPQRDLARALDVALGTVTHAYREAERRGLVTARVGRGTFVAATASVDTLGLPHAKDDVIEMSVDLPVHAEDPDLGPALRELAARDDLGSMLRYHAHEGLARHRRAGREWLERADLYVNEEDIAITAGTQHALTVSLLAIARPDDVVLCDRLTYPGIKAVTRHLHLRLVGVESDEQGVLPSAVEAACRQSPVTALYVTPSLHNPTTAQAGPERRTALARLAEANGFTILEDDAHRLLSDAPPAPIATLAPRQTFYIASLSKALTGGLRVAFLGVPPGRMSEVSQAIWATTWMVPTIAVEIAARWIEDGTADAVVARKRREVARRLDACRLILGDARFDAQPHGYFIWLHVPPPWSSAEFALEARRRGVAVTPSTAFLAGRAETAPAPAAVRVCIAAPESLEAMRHGIGILRDILERPPGESSPM